MARSVHAVELSYLLRRMASSAYSDCETIVRKMVESGTEYARDVWGPRTVRQFIQDRLSGRPALQTRSGEMARNVRFTIEEAKAQGMRGIIQGVFGVHVEYATPHEYGMTINAKPGKYMWVPGRDNPEGEGKAPIKNFRVFRSKQTPGNYVLVDKYEDLHMFTLARSVRIPPRMGMRDWMPTKVHELINALRGQWMTSDKIAQVLIRRWRMQ